MHDFVYSSWHIFACNFQPIFSSCTAYQFRSTCLMGGQQGNLINVQPSERGWVIIENHNRTNKWIWLIDYTSQFSLMWLSTIWAEPASGPTYARCVLWVKNIKSSENYESALKSNFYNCYLVELDYCIYRMDNLCLQPSSRSQMERG